MPRGSASTRSSLAIDAAHGAFDTSICFDERRRRYYTDGRRDAWITIRRNGRVSRSRDIRWRS